MCVCVCVNVSTRVTLSVHLLLCVCMFPCAPVPLCTCHYSHICVTIYIHMLLCTYVITYAHESFFVYISHYLCTCHCLCTYTIVPCAYVTTPTYSYATSSIYVSTYVDTYVSCSYICVTFFHVHHVLHVSLYVRHRLRLSDFLHVSVCLNPVPPTPPLPPPPLKAHYRLTTSWRMAPDYPRHVTSSPRPAFPRASSWSRFCFSPDGI